MAQFPQPAAMPGSEAGLRGLVYERACYSAAHRNWPDFRNNDMEPGAAGQGPGYGIA